jgi:hypothetical protein
MRADALAALAAIMRGARGQPRGTPGTAGTAALVPARQRPSFPVFRPFPAERDAAGKPCEGGTGAATGAERDDVVAGERSAFAIEFCPVPAAYADAWAAFQTRKPEHASERRWLQAVNDAGHFLDGWAGLALDLGWRPRDIFAADGVAFFCAGERARALGPHHAITASGRIFTRR